MGVLVLTRQADQRIVIEHPDGPIVISVGGHNGRQYKLCVNAPRSVAVHREEVWNEIHPNKQLERTPKP